MEGIGSFLNEGQERDQSLSAVCAREPVADDGRGYASLEPSPIYFLYGNVPTGHWLGLSPFLKSVTKGPTRGGANAHPRP